jgi:hypothetical protein
MRLKSNLILACSNPADLIRTVKSYEGFADETVIGYMFWDNTELEIVKNALPFGVKYNTIELSFNSLFLWGFAEAFSFLAKFASNDIVFLTGVGNDLVENYNIPCEPQFDCYSYQSADGFKNHTMWDKTKTELQWCIHEELKDRTKLDPRPQFRAAEIPKTPNPFYDRVREIVYNEQYRKVLDGEDFVNPDWERWIFRHEAEIRAALAKDPILYKAFQTGDLEMLNYAKTTT